MKLKKKKSRARRLPGGIAEKIESFCEMRTYCNEQMLDSSKVYANTVKSNIDFLNRNSKKGLSTKNKVLGILGVYITNGTEQQVEWAVSAAIHTGASKAEIADAMDLGILTGGGSAISRAQFGRAVLDYIAVAGAKSDRFQFAFDQVINPRKR